MTHIFDTIRLYDFKVYYHLSRLGLRSDFCSYLFYFFAQYGIVFFLLSFAYLIWKKKIKAFLCTLLAMGIGSLVDFLVFVFWRRPYPFTVHPEVSPVQISGLYLDASSFPSSHTYVAFAIATSIFLYGHKRLGALLFLMAIMVAIGNVGSGLHYPSDIVGGMLLGILSGVLVYLIFRKWESKSTGSY